MSSGPIAYSRTTAAAISFLDNGGDLTRAARALIVTGSVVIRRGRGAWRLEGGHFYLSLISREVGGHGGHGASDAGVLWVSLNKIQSKSDLRPRS